MEYFFDTYAPYEYIQGNSNYKGYFQSFTIITTRFNLIELFYSLLRDFDLEIAKKYYQFFLPFIVEFSDKVVERAMLFKIKYKDERLSYADCIGYALAQELGIRFLTGDEKFKDKSNVEFVK